MSQRLLIGLYQPLNPQLLKQSKKILACPEVLRVAVYAVPRVTTRKKCIW